MKYILYFIKLQRILTRPIVLFLHENIKKTSRSRSPIIDCTYLFSENAKAHNTHKRKGKKFADGESFCIDYRLYEHEHMCNYNVGITCITSHARM